MANQGFVQELNLQEVTDGKEIINNLAGGTAAADLLVFQGLASEKSQLFFNRFRDLASTEESGKSLELGTKFTFKDTVYNYTDNDIIEIQPINLIEDYDYDYFGFEDDGVLTNPLAGRDITFDRGQNYNPGTYEVLFKGGGGTFESAAATVVVSDGGAGSTGFRGQIQSVEITNSGTVQQSGDAIIGFSQGNVLSVSKYRVQGSSTYINGDIPGEFVGINGEGFTVTLIGFPWRVILVGNYAWDPSTLSNKDLTVEITNTSSKLDGEYTIFKNLTSSLNTFVLPNNSSDKAYDINRKIYAQEQLTSNLSLYDVDGDGRLSTFDIDLLAAFFTNSQNFDQTVLADFLDDVKNWVTNYITVNGLETGATRTNPVSLVAYMEGLPESIINIDNVGDEPSATDIGLMRTYIQNAPTPNYATAAAPGYLYVPVTATTSLSASEVNASGLGHVIATSVRVREYPNYTLDTEGYVKPFFTIYNNSGGSKLNIFDTFNKFGRKMLCTTSQTSWIGISIGSKYTQSGIDYRIADKYTSIVNNQTVYYVVVVASGNGFSAGSTFGNTFQLFVVNSSPVVASNDSGVEYGVFDANGRDSYFLKTSPRSNIQADKEIILVAEEYTIPSSESTTYSGVSVPTTTLFPDVIFKRDDTLTIENVLNLEAPEIFETAEISDEYGRDGQFSYNVDDGYSVELNNVIDNVDQTSYLKDQKYRVDRKLYYARDIFVDGLLTAYDPDGFNSNDNQLAEDASPGIFISDAGSQITNDLRSDFANKTRSFSSDYNPWSIGDGEIKTTSFRVNINDLVFTTSIDIDLRRDGLTTDNSKFVNGDGALGESLADNFSVSGTNPTAYKLKISINNEDFFLIMKKV